MVNKLSYKNDQNELDMEDLELFEMLDSYFYHNKCNLEQIDDRNSPLISIQRNSCYPELLYIFRSSELKNYPHYTIEVLHCRKMKVWYLRHIVN